MGCVGEGEENITCIPSHFTCISHSENGVHNYQWWDFKRVQQRFAPTHAVHMLYFSLTHL